MGTTKGMGNKKIFILLPDGVGLRNFAYTDFYSIGKKLGYDIVYWNNTPFPLTDLGFEEVKIERPKLHPFTDVYKNARKQIELNLNIQKTNDTVYDTYRFPLSYKTLKSSFKSIAVQGLTVWHASQKGLAGLRQKIKDCERKTDYYKVCLQTLKDEKPDMVFCTNQRPVLGISPILAAQELGIPTATFIFSWDNLPKATMVVETDYYFVWSDYMKQELMFYYPYIKEEQVVVTGTPQFEAHFDVAKKLPREQFFQDNGLDITKKYICYSGDDITTCPDDPQYLQDVADAVRKLNAEGASLGIVFRPSPADFSNRFEEVLQKNSDLIVKLHPKWVNLGGGWNAILPTPEDADLQVNTIAHTEFVINLGSSMVFDYASHGKPCVYLNYDVPNKLDKNWSVKKIYNYIHFRSMPSKKSVLWLNHSTEIENVIKTILSKESNPVEEAQKWFAVIAKQPVEKASANIWEGITKIISND
ncbi:UDP-glycosyltransferase [Flavobacterium pedocola]